MKIHVGFCNECHKPITAESHPWGCAPAVVQSTASNCAKCKAWTCGPQCTFAHAHHTAKVETKTPQRKRVKA